MGNWKTWDSTGGRVRGKARTDGDDAPEDGRHVGEGGAVPAVAAELPLTLLDARLGAVAHTLK